MEAYYVRRHHELIPNDAQCTSTVVKHIKAPADIIILIVGTKLRVILTQMALEITERHAVVQGIPLVQASDWYFWFSKPHLILHLIHFVLFQDQSLMDMNVIGVQ